MSSLANKISNSIEGQYFKHIHTGMVIETLELIYPSREDPNQKFLLVRSPLSGECMSIPYKDTTNYLTLSKAEADTLMKSLQGHSERLSKAAKNVASQYHLND